VNVIYAVSCTVRPKIHTNNRKERVTLHHHDSHIQYDTAAVASTMAPAAKKAKANNGAPVEALTVFDQLKQFTTVVSDTGEISAVKK
jgi:hypothetical protein